jgi:hypothetical protein
MPVDRGENMSDLLEVVMEAHGGLARWHQVSAVTIAVSITGGIWYVKGQADVLKDIVMVADTHQERVTTTFMSGGRTTVFEPDRVLIQGPDGIVEEDRYNPEQTFVGQVTETPWDAVQVAYFSGEALWTYLNTPVLFTRDGFVTEEVEPIHLEDQTWRRLKVIFPDEVKSHTREQFFAYGDDGLLRRHDYTVDILGGATGLNYASDYREVDGLMFPTTRRVYAYQGDYELVPEPLLVAVDISKITLS